MNDLTDAVFDVSSFANLSGPLYSCPADVVYVNERLWRYLRAEVEALVQPKWAVESAQVQMWGVTVVINDAMATVAGREYEFSFRHFPRFEKAT